MVQKVKACEHVQQRKHLVRAFSGWSQLRYWTDSWFFSHGAAVRNINITNRSVCMEVVGYLLEELRDADNFRSFKKDIAAANIFIGSLIFIEELAEKVRTPQCCPFVLTISAFVRSFRGTTQAAIALPDAWRVQRDPMTSAVSRRHHQCTAISLGHG